MSNNNQPQVNTDYVEPDFDAILANFSDDEWVFLDGITTSFDENEEGCDVSMKPSDDQEGFENATKPVYSQIVESSSATTYLCQNLSMTISTNVAENQTTIEV